MFIYVHHPESPLPSQLPAAWHPSPASAPPPRRGPRATPCAWGFQRGRCSGGAPPLPMPRAGGVQGVVGDGISPGMFIRFHRIFPSEWEICSGY